MATVKIRPIGENSHNLVTLSVGEVQSMYHHCRYFQQSAKVFLNKGYHPIPLDHAVMAGSFDLNLFSHHSSVLPQRLPVNSADLLLFDNIFGQQKLLLYRYI
jgi:hypothetical protein